MHDTNPARGCLIGLVLGLIMWVLIFFVASRAYAGAAESPAHAELKHYEEYGWDVPGITVVTFRPLFTGFVVYSHKPVQYVVVLRNWFYADDQARWTMGHELYHVLAIENGWPDLETNADLFAVCYGSEGARNWGLRMGKGGDCGELEGVLNAVPVAGSGIRGF